MSLDSKAAFLQLFSSRYSSQVRTVGSANWRKLSQFHQLSDTELLSSLSKDSGSHRALCIDSTESFLLMQFESVDQTLDQKLWSTLSAALSTLGLTGLKLFQVSDGGTYQVFIYLSKSAKVLPLVELLSRHLVQEGLDNVKVLKPGDHFALPLQDGYRWLSGSVQLVASRSELSDVMALNFFVGEVTKPVYCPTELLLRFGASVSCPGIADLVVQGVQVDLQETAMLTIFEDVSPERSLDSADLTSLLSLDSDIREFCSEEEHASNDLFNAHVDEQSSVELMKPEFGDISAICPDGFGAVYTAQVTVQDTSEEAALDNLSEASICLGVGSNLEAVDTNSSVSAPENKATKQIDSPTAVIEVQSDSTLFPDCEPVRTKVDNVVAILGNAELEPSSEITSEEQKPASSDEIAMSVCRATEIEVNASSDLDRTVLIGSETSLNAKFPSSEEGFVQLAFPFAANLIASVEPLGKSRLGRRKRAPPET